MKRPAFSLLGVHRMSLHGIFSVLFFTLITVGSVSIARSQTVTIHLYQPPPNELKAADLWVVALTNTTKNSYTVYIHATGYEVSNPSNTILVVDARTSNFTLHPGFHMVTGADISPVTVNSSNPTYRNIVTTTGQVPAGNYHICDTLIDAKTGAILGFDCIDQQVDVANPPVLVLPADGSSVPDKFPIFTWIAPSPLINMHALYTLKIVELYGQQSAYDAMLSNPAYFTASSISQTILQYPIASRPLESGKQFAWQITAVSTGNATQIPLGKSEVWEFTYDPTDPGGNGSGSNSSGDGTGSTGTGTATTGGAIGDLDPGNYADSTALANALGDYFGRNFLIPNGSTNLLPGDVLQGDSAYYAMYYDPNAKNFVPNNPNDSVSASGCGRPPSLVLSVVNPPFDQSAVNWHQPFSVNWAVRHSEPIDHIDLQIALFGHEDAPLAHYIYRTANGSVPTATTFDPRPYILNPDADGMICTVTAVAIDILGRSSGPVQQMYVNGNFPAIPHAAPPAMYSNFEISSTTADTLVIGGGLNGAGSVQRVMLHKIHQMHNGMSSNGKVSLINHDAEPHHFRSVSTPPYSDSAPLTVGGVAPIDFGEVLPGGSSTITVPSGATECYLWTLYDIDASSFGGSGGGRLSVEVGPSQQH